MMKYPSIVWGGGLRKIPKMQLWCTCFSHFLYLPSMSRASQRHTCPKQPSPRMLNTLRWCRGNSQRSSDLVFPDPGVCCWNISVVQSSERKAQKKDLCFSCMKLQCALKCHYICKACQMYLVRSSTVPYLSHMTTTFTHKQDDTTYTDNPPSQSSVFRKMCIQNVLNCVHYHKVTCSQFWWCTRIKLSFIMG